MKRIKNQLAIMAEDPNVQCVTVFSTKVSDIKWNYLTSDMIENSAYFLWIQFLLCAEYIRTIYDFHHPSYQGSYISDVAIGRTYRIPLMAVPLFVDTSPRTWFAERSNWMDKTRRQISYNFAWHMKPSIWISWYVGQSNNILGSIQYSLLATV